MWEIFLIGTFWFWALLAIEFIALLAFVEHECPGWAIFSLVGACCLLQFFGDVPMIYYITHNPWIIVAGLGIYVLIGAPWGCLKWWLHLRNLREEYTAIKREWITLLKKKVLHESNANLKEIYQEVITSNKITLKARKHWLTYLDDNYGYSCKSRFDKPELRHNKGRIIMWMAYWPFSMLWTIINDPIRKLFRQVYHSLEGLLQRITDSVWKDIDNDFGEE